MNTLYTSFVQSHPEHVFDENDKTDYSVRDKYFIQCLKSIEAVKDIDAYIMNHKNQCIIDITKGSSFYTGEKLENIKNITEAVQWMNNQKKIIKRL